MQTRRKQRQARRPRLLRFHTDHLLCVLSGHLGTFTPRELFYRPQPEGAGEVLLLPFLTVLPDDTLTEDRRESWEERERTEP